jgi:hypothetical protein
MDCESFPRVPYYYLTIGSSAPEGEPRVVDTITEHRPPVGDPQICDHTAETGFTDDESLSDDEFFDCFQPGDGPEIMEPVPSSVDQPLAHFPAEIDSGEASRSQSLNQYLSKLSPKHVGCTVS